MARKGQRHVPPTLEASGRHLWKIVQEHFALEPHHEVILRQACEALDRAEGARARIATEGLTVKDRFGVDRAHPLLATERDSRAAFLRALAALGLDIEAVGGIGRSPGR
jgi:P27 family predicted phage terminase small subunit